MTGSTGALAMVGGASLWPLNGSVGWYRAGLARVASKVRPGESAGVHRREFGSLPEAVSSVAGEFHLPKDRATFLASTAGDEWTAAFVSSFPRSDIGGYYADRAERDLRCDYVAYTWAPGSPATVDDRDAVLSSAMFLDYRAPGRWSRKGASRDHLRTVQVTDQGGRWTFDQLGPQREYEQPDAYGARRKADRLTLSMITDYLQGAGLPAGNEDFVHGPVVAVVESGLGPDRSPWASVRDLRRACGYPDARIPDRLAGWGSAS